MVLVLTRTMVHWRFLALLPICELARSITIFSTSVGVTAVTKYNEIGLFFGGTDFNSG